MFPEAHHFLADLPQSPTFLQFSNSPFTHLSLSFPSPSTLPFPSLSHLAQSLLIIPRFLTSLVTLLSHVVFSYSDVPPAFLLPIFSSRPLLVAFYSHHHDILQIFLTESPNTLDSNIFILFWIYTPFFSDHLIVYSSVIFSTVSSFNTCAFFFTLLLTSCWS